ncbi:MAG: flippase-like domain-containing protein [Methanomicrobiales archaeon]|nr:flippase-like domain-containing protein [Methanomicrobiales archaeon]
MEPSPESQPLSVSCIIPAHNEEGNIENVVNHILPVLDNSSIISDYELVLVDDNSSDATGQIIDRLARDNPSIRVVHRSSSPGFGNAVKAGLAVATKSVLIPVMGDLSDDPEDIVKLVKRIGMGYDIAYGSRFVPGGALYGYPRKKMLANRLFNNTLRVLFGIRHRDISNAFKAYRREVLDEIGISNLESTGFDLTIEIPLKAHIAGFSSSEVPVRWYDRTEGEAKLKLSRNATVYGKRLLSLFIWGNVTSLKDLFHAVLKGSKIGILLAFVLGLGILALMFSISGFGNVITYLTNISIFWFTACLISIFVSFLFRTWRWSVLMRSCGYTTSRELLFKSIMFGWLINYLVPARLGDISRAIVLKICDEKPIGVTLSTIVVERAFDTFTLGILLFTLSIFSKIPGLILFEVGAALLTLLLIFGLIIAYLGEKFVTRIFQNHPSVIDSIKLLNVGMRDLATNPSALLLCLGLSCAVWIFELMPIFFAAKSIGIDIVPLAAASAGIVAFILQSLPLTPAGLGIHEVSISGILQIFGLSSDVGMSIAIIDHVSRAFIIYVFGILSAIHLGFASRSYFRKRGNNDE